MPRPRRPASPSAQRLMDRRQEHEARRQAGATWRRLTPAQQAQAQRGGLQAMVGTFLDAFGLQELHEASQGLQDDMGPAAQADPWEQALGPDQERGDVLDVEWEEVEA